MEKHPDSKARNGGDGGLVKLWFSMVPWCQSLRVDQLGFLGVNICKYWEEQWKL